MSSSAQRGPGAVAPADDKKKGISRVFGRMKTVLRRSDGSKRLPFAAKSSTQGQGIATAESRQPKSTTSAPTPKQELEVDLEATPGLKETSVSIPAATIEAEQYTSPSSYIPQTQIQPHSQPQPYSHTNLFSPSQPQPIKISRALINAERARKLAEKFQLQIEPHEWHTLDGAKDAWRIEKPIRMRIHRTCHKCNTTYGANKICANCKHPRCTKCPRYPLKKEKGRTVLAGLGPVPVMEERGVRGAEREGKETEKKEKLVMTMPSKTKGGQPLVRKKPMQRVRRNCHECGCLYAAGSKICARCEHMRCADCPRDPPKKKKYPDGYPGDVPSPTSGPKFACHKCDKTFPVAILNPTKMPQINSPDTSQNPGTSTGMGSPDQSLNEQICKRCKHRKCADCKLALPRKVVPDLEVDELVLRRVEERLGGLSLSLSAGRGGVWCLEHRGFD